jgi:hypothetical protein
MLVHQSLAGCGGAGLKTKQDLFVGTGGADLRVQVLVTMLPMEIAQPEFQFGAKGAPQLEKPRIS